MTESTPPPPAAEPVEPLPVPIDAHLPRPRPRASAPLVVLATLAVGFTLWAAQDVILPVLLAAFFALIGNPLIRLLRRLYVPRFLAAVLVLVAGRLPAPARWRCSWPRRRPNGPSRRHARRASWAASCRT